MIEVLLLAVALSMDALAISIGMGSKKSGKPLNLALMCGAYFGVSQALMPLFGYLAGQGVLGWVEAYAPWIAALLLVLIGTKMIVESFAENIEDDIRQITHRVMLILAIATSIDAMAAGFALTLIDVNILLACLMIGATTYVFSVIGVYIGDRGGTWLESRAELVGGIVLIAMGISMVRG